MGGRLPLLRFQPGVQDLRFIPTAGNHEHAGSQALAQNIPA